ncbi:MAG: NfeD family protein [Rhodospirillales bacterium]|nr:NfeD family protein [Rhodospirillales bacterium]
MFDTLLYWHWWILAVVLIILELTISGTFFFLFLGGAAVIVGLAAMIPGVTWEIQLFLFATLSIVSVFSWRKWKPKPRESEHPTLNKRGHQYIDRQFTLGEPIVNNTGKLIVADTTWKITGPDLPSGTQVTVVEVVGTALRVEKTGAEAG